MRTTRSQNGWRANQRALVSTFTVPGTSVKLPLRKDYAGPLLVLLAEAFHRRVEPLVEGWCWGYAERSIRGASSTVSNHASGTAIDLNAPRHPLGARGTFSASQRAELERLLKLCEGTVRWGGHYRSRADEMHLEINTTDLARIQHAAQHLRAELRRP
jgi:hypothetical protein